MDIKEYLNQIQRYEKVINNKLEEIDLPPVLVLRHMALNAFRLQEAKIK